MSLLVIDASVAVDWLLDDEFDPRASAALTRLQQEGAIVPQLWQLEVRSALLAAERRGRLSANQVDMRLADLMTLPIRTDATPDLVVAFALSRAHRLSLYDSIYLELAVRHQAALASLGAQLIQAGIAEGLSVIDP